jgi:hypothetical protein
LDGTLCDREMDQWYVLPSLSLILKVDKHRTQRDWMSPLHTVAMAASHSMDVT